jgi:hypothetical protein
MLKKELLKNERRKVGGIFSQLDHTFAAFGECRQAQRNIIESVNKCKIGPGGAASKEDAAVQLNATNK